MSGDPWSHHQEKNVLYYYYHCHLHFSHACSCAWAFCFAVAPGNYRLVLRHSNFWKQGWNVPKSYHCRLNGEGSLQHGDSKRVKRCIWNGASGHAILILARYLPVTAAISNNATASEFVRLRDRKFKEKNKAYWLFTMDLVFPCPRQ